MLRAEGIDAIGPLAADTMFHAARARRAMTRRCACYHDQALIPLKTLHFDEGVNITLGLPIVRTSPDHGTAFDIAGQDRADPGAMIAAIAHGRRAPPSAAPRGVTLTPSTALPPLREVIARHGLGASKALGQNFLLDGQLLARIARGARATLPAPRCYEVGPGPGGLTRALLGAGARVTAVERDRRCMPALAELGEAYPGRLRVIEGDALAIDAPALFAGRRAHRRQPALQCRHRAARPLADRPTWPPWWRSLTLMFQKEVAERIVADAGQRRLWPAGGAGAVAHRRARIAMHGPPLGLHAAAQGDVGGGPHRAGRRSPTGVAVGDARARSPPPRSASGARCCGRA